MYEELIYWMESLARGTAGRKVARAAADAIDALQAENGSKDKEIVKLKLEKELMRQEWDTLHAALSRVEAERDAAAKCIYDVETYLQFGSAPYIMTTIEAWKRGAQGEG